MALFKFFCGDSSVGSEELFIKQDVPGISSLTDTNGKVIQCHAAVFWEKDQPAEIEMIDVKVPAEDEVRIKMVGAGICQSDIYGLQGLMYPHPIIVGHEGVGVVESVGANVKTVKTGDPVIPLWAYQCKECRLCKIGRRNYCRVTQKSAIEGWRITCKGQEVNLWSGLGLFSEYIVVKHLCALKIKAVPNLERLALYGCCIPTGYGAAMYTAQVYPGAICAVWGLGAVGLSAVLGCRDAGAARIIGINRGKGKFALAG